MCSFGNEGLGNDLWEQRRYWAVSCSVEPGRLRIRRALLCIAGLITVVLGLSIRTLSDAAWTGPAGDGLYAVLVYVLVGILIPSKSKTLIAAAAVTVCVLIELFQLTGLPAELGKSWPPIRLVLGTTFGTADLFAYAGGAAVAYAVDWTTGTVVNCARHH
ncbi:DUF2809 domain-containing protein [Arthrobacter sp. ISL-48]|uniref:ribosomal maturation YjgA family protein n=1 Tax=Arthrobacter sp. ISL-48 TaxID=2819110 RepID=UPI001BE754E4|nr:DUF2809 domain-containing protein [Arthrobacter sp. ISL-48]MBT2533351.1 DUF2809 domain-containing protein [Arthrobacter sp. ISL-48]